MEVSEQETTSAKKQGWVGGEGVKTLSLWGNIYGTGERNPWEFKSLAYESNSSSKKERQVLSSGTVVRNTKGR